MSAPVMLAEFGDPGALVAAARRAREAGLRNLDAHTPFLVEDLADALDLPPGPPLRKLMLAAGLAGAALAYGLCWYAAVIDYPFQVGGRPQHAWQAFLVLAFEGGLLAAAVAGAVGVFVGAGLPRLHHPVFAAEGFERASQDRFFLSVADPDADLDRLRAVLGGLGPLSVRAVPA